MGHDLVEGQFRVFNSDYQRQIIATAETYVQQPDVWQQAIKDNPQWVVANPLRALLLMWMDHAKQQVIKPKLTVILDCCHSGNEVAVLQQMQAEGLLDGFQIAVFAAAASDKLAWGYNLVRLMKNEGNRAEILSSQRPCYAATSTYHSVVFEAVAYGPQDLIPQGVPIHQSTSQPNSSCCIVS